MNKVNPIKDWDLVSQIKKDLEKNTNDKGKRQYLLFVSGIYLGLRISDLLSLKVKDVLGKKVLVVIEKKTKKENEVPISPDLQSIYNRRLKGLPANQYLFISRNKDKNGMAKSISRKTAYNDINEICSSAGMFGNYGCHTLRKTFGYFLYTKTKDFALVMDWLNHSNLNITKRYIGLDLDKREQAAKILKF